MATHSSVLAWKTPWMEEPGRLQPMGSRRVGHDWHSMTYFHFSLLCTGEGNGSPLQGSCLENPRDGVAQSQTQLNWLSRSSTTLGTTLNILQEESEKECVCVCVCLSVRFTQSCPTLCNTTECSPPGASVHGIPQARILERAPFSSPGGLPNPRIEPRSPALRVDSLQSEPAGKPHLHNIHTHINMSESLCCIPETDAMW